jgi:predicted transposase/invertase (TIGR01784 family)
MRDYLEAHSSEVKNMLFTEYNAEDEREVLLAEGRIEGEAKGKAEVARNMKLEGIAVDTISKVTGLSKEEIENL